MGPKLEGQLEEMQGRQFVPGKKVCLQVEHWIFVTHLMTNKPDCLNTVLEDFTSFVGYCISL